MWSSRMRLKERPHTETSSRATDEVGAVPSSRRVHMDEPGALRRLTEAIAQRLPLRPLEKPIVVVCVGSDRSTGDALGPLVGTRLAQRVSPLVAEVRGTLERPVHAANLSESLRDLTPDRLAIAVDACLGRAENVGTICVKDGALQPGTGVNKTLPSVGDFHIVGVVNVGGFMEYFVLQNTRLSLVVRLAELVADSLCFALDRFAGHETNPQVAASRDL